MLKINDVVGIKHGEFKNIIGKIVRIDTQLILFGMNEPSHYHIKTKFGTTIITNPKWLEKYDIEYEI